ncbi:MAG TPA: efflux RND transporter permease subunit [Steroidobacteraceae bacterium]|nr:efflux RND transporter permease subunit [Steroidobacteraceae bacterium]
MNEPSVHLGPTGRIARHFLYSQLTPLLALIALLAGLFAVLVTPREEDPQIDVTFANIFVPFPGASAAQVEHLVSTPMERVLAEISGIKHIYSVSRPGVAVVSVQFQVGIHRNDALVRLYNAVYSHQDWRPAGLGVGQPLIKPKGIDDVPIVTLTLWSTDAYMGGLQLGQVARALQSQLQRVPGTRTVDVVGGQPTVLSVRLDPTRLTAVGLTVDQLQSALRAANFVRQAGDVVDDGRLMPVQAGEFLSDADQVAGLIVATRDGKPVYLRDVARVTDAPQAPSEYAWIGAGTAGRTLGLPMGVTEPAVTLAISKKPGSNAIDVARGILQRVQQLRSGYLPAGVHVTVTRNYGVTANDKANKLIEKLIFATVSVVLLVLLAVGRREAAVVGAAVIVTLAATLFASWAYGFTINRVSLFALIFSIGILVDDAIVIVENVHRHLQLQDEGTRLIELMPRAVDEVGGPTVLATLTVIAALLPMAFVSGLMGPYMSPIPINASMGMLLSLAVALIFTPWLCRVLMTRERAHPAVETGAESAMQRLFRRVLVPFLSGERARRRRHWLYGGICAAILLAVALVGVRLVVLKMLPFDNKSEFQVILDMPEGTPLERTAAVLGQLGSIVARTPEVTDYEAYAGTSAPINFNGLVRQYYLRAEPNQGDLEVDLVDKSLRSRQSHDIARALRPALARAAARLGAESLQVVEVPPGPPVQAPLVAEIYAPSYAQERRLGRSLRALFDSTPDIVDTDDSVGSDAPRLIVTVDRAKAGLLGVPVQRVVSALSVALAGEDVTYVHRGPEEDPIAVHLQLASADRADLSAALALPISAADGHSVPLAELVQVQHALWDAPRYHKDLLPVTYVTGDMAGPLDSPLYGMFRLMASLRHRRLDGRLIEQHLLAPPTRPEAVGIKWDGEWQITYETFRDMGLAYSVGLVLIYLLIVAQFRSYALPLIIMAPIPLTIIGVMPGHALLRAQFTATSMIGMIALAGIIVRNSILLVDFIRAQLAQGVALEQAVVHAAAIRARPILLTAVAAMLGAVFILDDPIFQGLAVSLLFGIMVSTLLTLLVIPILFFSYQRRLAVRASTGG